MGGHLHHTKNPALYQIRLCMHGRKNTDPETILTVLFWQPSNITVWYTGENASFSHARSMLKLRLVLTMEFMPWNLLTDGQGWYETHVQNHQLGVLKTLRCSSGLCARSCRVTAALPRIAVVEYNTLIQYNIYSCFKNKTVRIQGFIDQQLGYKFQCWHYKYITERIVKFFIVFQ